MASRILLISTNRCEWPDPVFPLGLAHLNAALRRAGHQTEWFDVQAAPEDLQRTLAAYRPDFVGISLRNIDDVLINKREVFFEQLQGLCQEVRQVAGCPVILGGSGFSIFPQELMSRTGADYGVHGEGEATLLALVKALTNGGQIADLPGLLYRKNGEIVMNPRGASAFADPLSTEDRPARLVAHYLNKSSMLNVQTQRGCAFKCCYCTYPLIEGRALRRRPPEWVAEEMAQLQAHGARYAFIVDSIFNSSPEHVAGVCEALLRRKVNLKWGCFLRPQGLTRELMKLMARAGLSQAEFGTDSFCDSVLASYGKHFTFDDVQQSSEFAREAGIDYCHFLICGGPGETMATLAEGHENSRRLKEAIILAIVGMRIYPGTGLCERALREGVIQAGDDLLAPSYYIAPGLTQESVFEKIREFAQLSPNWIVGDPAPGFTKLVDRLRQRGIVGPLWSYFSMMQRLMPRPAQPQTA